MQWEKQHCGVHQADLDSMLHLMPDIAEIVQTFPDNGEDYVWDVKVHMLMPNQFPCIPNWHYDNVPRVNNKQDFDLVTPNLPMWLWVSGPPLTEFERQDGTRYLITPKEWHRFTQTDKHRGKVSTDFQWRGFIRATHKEIMTKCKRGDDCLRRHSQVYLDVNTFTW